LKKKAKDLSLKVSGTKEQLAFRIVEHEFYFWKIKSTQSAIDARRIFVFIQTFHDFIVVAITQRQMTRSLLM